MNEYITLLGAEQVQRAVADFARAVHEFSVAASSLSEALRHDREERWQFLEAVRATRVSPIIPQGGGG